MRKDFYILKIKKKLMDEEENAGERYLLLFPSHEACNTFKTAFAIDPPIDHDTLIGSAQYLDKQFDISVVPRDMTAEMVVARYNQSVYNKVLVLSRARLNIEEMPSNWYMIRTVPDLEDALHITLTTEQLRALTSVQNSQRRSSVRYSYAMPAEFFQIIQQLVGMDDDQVARTGFEQFQQPEVRTRTPLNAQWEEKLKDKSPPPPTKKQRVDDSLCVICLTSETNVVCLPCAHQCVCDICIVEILERDDQKKKCPICREEIQDIVKPIK